MGTHLISGESSMVIASNIAEFVYDGKKQLNDLGSLMKYMKTQFYHHKQQLGDSKSLSKLSFLLLSCLQVIVVMKGQNKQNWF